jgi:hypothetical protein
MPGHERRNEQGAKGDDFAVPEMITVAMIR